MYNKDDDDDDDKLLCTQRVRIREDINASTL